MKTGHHRIKRIFPVFQWCGFDICHKKKLQLKATNLCHMRAESLKYSAEIGCKIIKTEWPKMIWRFAGSVFPEKNLRSNELQIGGDERRGYQQAVKPIKKSAMARERIARILDLDAALEQRLNE